MARTYAAGPTGPRRDIPADDAGGWCRPGHPARLAAREAPVGGCGRRPGRVPSHPRRRHRISTYPHPRPRPDPTAGLSLYWIPLGAGGHCVRFSGRLYESVLALAGRRRARELFHAALVAHVGGRDTTIEVAPVWQHGEHDLDRGVTVSGPVGLRVLGRWSWFRYEVRCWPGGTIPDLADAVGGPQRLDADEHRCRALLAAAHDVPALTWGRDEQGLGEMWNSNSVVAWLLVRAGVDAGRVRPPAGGRAPGWDAGVAAAQIQLGNHIRQRHWS